MQPALQPTQTPTLLQLLVFATLLLGRAAASLAFKWETGVAPRLQWEGNNGFCGEVTQIQACLRLGGCYLSQYDVRALGAAGVGSAQVQSQLLVGVNDVLVADKTRLLHEEYPASSSASVQPQAYLAWIKAMTRAGAVTSVSLYMNMPLFEETVVGDDEYDHIVTVLSVESNYDDDAYHDDDVLTIEDHGVYTPNNKPLYLFSLTFKDWIATRSAINNKHSNKPYAIPDCPTGNYGIAYTGIADGPKKECKPIVVEVDRGDETPEISDGSNKRPAPVPISLKVTVSDLKPGKSYTLFTYNDPSAVPLQQFNAHASSTVAYNRFVASSAGIFVFNERIKSSDMRFYRAVLASNSSSTSSSSSGGGGGGMAQTALIAGLVGGLGVGAAALALAYTYMCRPPARSVAVTSAHAELELAEHEPLSPAPRKR